MAAAEKGNVLWVDFGGRKKVDKPEDIPEPEATVQHVAPAERLRRAVHAQTDHGRIDRGLGYFEAGHVLEIEPRQGSIHASVAGSQNTPFHVSVVLPYRSTEDLAQLTRLIAETPNGVARARIGGYTSEALDLLVGSDTDDISFSCDCPDHVRACKHAVAAVEKIATRMDADPEMILRVRNLDLRQLEEAVMADSEAKAAEATEDGSDHFFAGRPLPDLPEPKVAPAIDDSDLDLLHKAMRQVSYTNVDQMRAVADLEDFYDHLTREEE